MGGNLYVFFFSQIFSLPIICSFFCCKTFKKCNGIGTLFSGRLFVIYLCKHPCANKLCRASCIILSYYKFDRVNKKPYRYTVSVMHIEGIHVLHKILDQSAKNVVFLTHYALLQLVCTRCLLDYSPRAQR